jgi:hypothetical protein
VEPFRRSSGPRAISTNVSLAVAPLGREQVTIRVPQGVNQVSLLGEILEALSAAGRETAAPGRPVALVSNINVEYRPLKGKR